jgi:ubiquinone/menaquinone biosynthesis C-methylase UbiE
MGFYQRRVFPWLLHHSMKNREVGRWRAKVIPAARGRVLEIGVGSGLNLPHYSGRVTGLSAIDPSPELLALARRMLAGAELEVSLLQGSAEALPFDDGSFDSVVSTWTLCSIGQVSRALGELRRVLRPDGTLIFIEHGQAPDPRVARWQDRLNPLWNRCAGGCNLNRRIDRLIAEAGFRITGLETGYLIKGPRPLTYHYQGQAEPA